PIACDGVGSCGGIRSHCCSKPAVCTGSGCEHRSRWCRSGPTAPSRQWIDGASPGSPGLGGSWNSRSTILCREWANDWPSQRVQAKLAAMTSTLYVCATPIGNLADASPRLVETLGEVDVVYAEDTRRTGRLLQALGVTADLRSYFVGNELSRSDEIRRHLEAGRDVA